MITAPLIYVGVEAGVIVGEMRRSVCVESSWEGREYYCELSENKPLCSVALLVWPVEGGANNTRHPVIEKESL